MTSKKDCLVFARRLYVDKEPAESVAKSVGCSEKYLVAQARTAIPALISKEQWTVKDVMARLRGNSVPAEMRNEVIGLHKTHGLVETAKMAGLPEGTLSRWVNGKSARKGKSVLSMGKRPWARLDGSGPDEGSGSSSKPRGRKRGPYRQVSTTIKEKAVHRFTNEGLSATDVAREFGVSESAIYAWRLQVLGKLTDPKFGDKARALAKEFVTQARIDDQIDGHAVPDPMASASSMLSEVATEGSAKQHVGTMEVLSNRLAKLDAEFESLGKDRQLVAQEIEIQQLRRLLSDR